MPDQVASATITADSSITASAVGQFVAAVVIAVTATFSANAQAQYKCASTISVTATLLATAEEQEADRCTITAGSTCTASAHAHYTCASNMLASSAFEVAGPIVTHHFPPFPFSPSKIPVVRSVPQPPPLSHVTIQANKAVTQTGSTVQVNVTRTKK